MTLKTGVGVRQAHWKYHHSIERMWRSIVTMALSCVVSEIFNVEKCRDLEIGSKVTQDHRNRHISIRHLWFRVIGLSRTVSGQTAISIQIGNFPPPRVFCPPLNGFALELGIVAWSQKTTVMGLLGRRRSMTISSAVWIQSTNVTDRQTNGRTPGDSKDRTYALRRAVKKSNTFMLYIINTYLKFLLFCHKYIYIKRTWLNQHRWRQWCRSVIK